MAKNYYDILGVDKSASADEIKSAYRRLAKKYHPDVYATAPEKEKMEAEDKFKEIQYAYDVLSDPQKKAAFDQYGDENGPTMGGSGFNPFGQGGFSSSSGFGGFRDIFSDIFSAFSGGGSSSGGRAAANQPRQGDDIELETVLTFKEACFGCKKEVTYSRIEKCPTCGGTGAKGANGIKTCTKCGGRGRIVVQQRTMLGVMQTERVCDMCGGTGKIITDPCPDCKGKGRIRKQRKVTINIPAGVDNGQMLNQHNEGNAGYNGGPNGNLILIFRVKPHPLFTRRGNDLLFDLPITITQAVFGDTVEIPTLDKPVRFDIPAGTKNGTLFKVKGKGVKDLRRNAYGDILVTVKIDIPKDISLKQRKELKQYFDELDKTATYDEVEKYKKKIRTLD